MPRADLTAAKSAFIPGASVDRFFQLALLGLVASGYLAVAGSGYLDRATIIVTAAGLLVRALWIWGVLRLEISERATTFATLAYAAFFILDYYLLSRDFLSATVHLLFFLAVMKILTARTNRDYLYTAVIAFLELLAAAILSVNFNFILFLALYTIFAIAALTSGEIRRGMRKSPVTARSGLSHFSRRLGVLAGFTAATILALTACLFFVLPRTAEAALEHLVSHRIFIPGFSNHITLGQIGELKVSSRPVMHIRIWSAQRMGSLKWRGGALTEFDGKRWSNAARRPDTLEIAHDHIDLSPGQRPPGRRINYHVDLEPIETDSLFFAGKPETLDLRARAIYRTDAGVYRTDGARASHALPQGLHYDAYGLLEDPPETAAPLLPAPVLPLAARERNLQLPPLDRRIPELARAFTETALTDLERTRAIERRLRTGYGYTLELPATEPADPLAHFLFARRKGHCEYFASAMAVMLRSIGIPARLATGFQSGVFNSISDLWLIRTRDAHSWVEAWIPGRGWTTFDPTPPDPGPSDSLALLSRFALYLDAAETFWQDWVVTYDIARQGTLADRIEQGAQHLGIRWFDALVAIRGAWTRVATPAWQRLGLWLALLPVMAIVLWFGLPPLMRRLHMRRRVERVRRGKASVADATVLYQRMLHILHRRGFQKPPWFTPAEFAAGLPPTPLGRAVSEFTTSYNALRFGGHTGTAARLSILLDQLERT